MKDDTLDALDANYLDANRLLVGAMKSGEYLERRDVAVVCCGLPVEQLNWGFLKRSGADPCSAAAAARAYFEGRGLPFRVVLRADGSEPTVSALEADGWRRHPSATPGMTLALPAAAPPRPASLEIREVLTADALVAYREAAFAGFGFPVGAARLFLCDPLLGRAGVRLYSGFVDGAVVATSMYVRTGDVAGIYWVATVEGSRGRGHGAALTWAAVDAGRADGCRIASLQASQSGRPVYTRMGFDHVLDYVSLAPSAG